MRRWGLAQPFKSVYSLGAPSLSRSLRQDGEFDFAICYSSCDDYFG